MQKEKHDVIVSQIMANELNGERNRSVRGALEIGFFAKLTWPAPNESCAHSE